MSKIIIISNISKGKNEKIYCQIKDFASSPNSEQPSKLGNQEIKRIENQLFNDLPLSDSFSYREISLWWFFHWRLSKQLTLILDLIINITKFIKKEKPILIKQNAAFDKFQLIKQICEKENIRFEYSRIRYFGFKIKYHFKHIFRKYIVSILFNRTIKKRKKLFSKYKKNNINLNNKILFSVAPVLNREIFNFNKKKSEKGEYLIQDIINLLENKNNAICLDFFSGLTDNNLLYKRLKSDLNWIPLEFIYYKKFSNLKKEFLNKYNRIIKSKEFQDLFKFHQISIWDSLKEIFHDNLLENQLPYWMDLIDSFDTFFSKHKPKFTIIPHENSPQNLALIVGCKKHNIKTFGLQHGFIWSNQNGYNHTRLANEKDSLGFPFAEKFLVFGEITKKILISNSYPSEKIIVFGNPSYFNLKKKLDILKTMDLYNKNSIKKNTKTILHSSSAFQELFYKNSRFNFDVQIWDYLLKTYGNNDQYQIILKPHPNEPILIYKKILEKYKCKNAKIIRENFIELALISSVVISISSTTIYDALVVKKPVIQLKFDDIHLPTDDYKNSVLQCNLKNLSKNIELILNTKEIQSKLIFGGNVFIKEFFNLIEIKSESELLKILNIDL